MSSQIISALERVRAATDEQHRALERLPRLERLFAEDYQLDEYAELLRRLLGFHRAAERAFGSFRDSSLLRFALRDKASDAIAADLAALGIPANGRVSEPMPFLGDSDAARTGLLYVVEGSKLGGSVIRRRLEQKFVGLPALRYHAEGDERTAAAWRATKTRLDISLEPNALADAIDGARASFACLQRWLA